MLAADFFQIKDTWVTGPAKRPFITMSLYLISKQLNHYLKPNSTEGKLRKDNFMWISRLGEQLKRQNLLIFVPHD